MTMSSSSGVEPVMPRPGDLEAFYAAFLFPGPAYDEASPGEESRELLQAHVSYVWRSQHGDGPAIAGGPLLADPSQSDIPRGMTILRAESLLEARRLAAADPAVVTGHFRVVVVPWLVAPGRFFQGRPLGK
jgi:uncharacterized protein YciI